MWSRPVVPIMGLNKLINDLEHTNLIFLSNVAKFYNGKPLIEDVNISIHRGDRVGIVGPNGAGKSTILGMMEGLIAPDKGEVAVEKGIRMGILRQELVQGSDGPILDEVTHISDDLKKIRERLASLEAELEEISDASPQADALIEEHGGLLHEFERYDGYTLESRALKVLRGLGFGPEDAGRKWSEFSGGWRMRVALAKILLAQPEVLLLDEPTNHLDLESLLWVESYLSDFKGAIVLVSHDRAFLNRIVQKIVEVDRGKATLYSGDYDTYEQTHSMQEEVQLASFKNQQKKIERIQKFIDKNRVKARTASRVQSRVKMIEKMDRVEAPKRSRTVKFKFPQPPPCGRRAVEIKNLSKRYGDKVVYRNFDLVLERGEKIGLVGPNGAGKSTLMKIVGQVIAYDSGEVNYATKAKVGYLAQHQSEALVSERTVLEEAAASASGLTEQELRNLLGAFLFSGDDVQKKVKVLSGGEKNRLALTKILLSPPNILLMDEPTNHLDIPSCEVLEQGLEQFQGTLMLISHDRRLMNRICTAILEIQDGKAELFPGNYDYYQYKKRLMEKEAAQQSPPDQPQPKKPATDAPPSTESRESKKEKKRREAEARSTLHTKQAPLKKELRKIEKELETRETRKKEIEAIMADPSSYENRSLIVSLLEEEPALTKEIRELEAKWEKLSGQLDEIERTTVVA